MASMADCVPPVDIVTPEALEFIHDGFKAVFVKDRDEGGFDLTGV